MNSSHSRVPAPQRPTQPATKAEVDHLRQKIVEKLENNTAKAVTILIGWLKNQPKK